MPANPSLLGEAPDIATGGKLEVRLSDITPTELLKTLGPIANGGTAHVPCGSCTACCYYGRTDVNPAEETLASLSVLQMEEDAKGLYLKRREDGGCIHLGANGGCAVWEHRPRVCRAYDCRPMGMAGLAPCAVASHAAPVWEFRVETPLDRAIVMAAKLAAQPYFAASQTGAPDPEGNALTTILKGIFDHLPRTRRLVAAFDALPESEQRKFTEMSYKADKAEMESANASRNEYAE